MTDLQKEVERLKELMRKVWHRIPPWESLKDPEQYNAMMGDIAGWVTDATLWPLETPRPAQAKEKESCEHEWYTPDMSWTRCRICDALPTHGQVLLKEPRSSEGTKGVVSEPHDCKAEEWYWPSHAEGWLCPKCDKLMKPAAKSPPVASETKVEPETNIPTWLYIRREDLIRVWKGCDLGASVGIRAYQYPHKDDRPDMVKYYIAE